MSRRAALAAVCVLLGSAAAADAPANPTLDELLSLLAARRHGHVAFTEVHEMAMLKEPLQSSGELSYDAPDRLEKRTLKPTPEVLLLEHGVLTMQRGHRQRVVTLADTPQLVPFVESIRATLAGDRAALEHYFTVGCDGDLAHWTLHLVPKEASVARSVQEVRISGERDAIREVEIRQGDGDRSRLTIGPEVTP